MAKSLRGFIGDLNKLHARHDTDAITIGEAVFSSYGEGRCQGVALLSDLPTDRA